jgi:hypothetical protein
MLSASNGQSKQSGQGANGRGETAKERVRTYITERPESPQMPVNKAVLTPREAGVRAGRTTTGEVVAEKK